MDKSGDEPGLTKAQIKRRRKKALAAVAAAKAEAEHLEVEKDDVSQPANKENIKKKDDNLKSSTVGGKKGKKGSGESSSTQRPSSLDTSKGGLKVSHVSPDTVQALDSLLSGAATAKVASKSSSSSAHKLVTSKSPTKYTIPPSKSESSSVSASSKSASKNGTKAGNKPIPPAKAAAVGVPKSVSKLYKPTAEVSRPPGNYTSTASRILNEAKAKDLFRAENDSPMAQVEQAKTKKVLSEAAANSETDMSEEAVEELIQDLSALSYPVIADLLESVNTLPSSPPKSDPSQTHRPKNVSVLADPFCMLTDGSTEPDQGAIAFVKRKTKVSPPPRRALPSSDPTHSKDAKENGPAALDSSLVPATSGATGSKGPESDSDGARNDTPMTDRLSYLLSELSKESKDEEEKVMDYTFHSMSSSLLPKRLRDLVESEERGEAMEPMIISQEEYQEMLVNLKEHGTSHVEGESKDTESVLCLPSQLNLDAELLTELSREFIGVCEEKEEEEVVEVEEEIDEEAEEEIAQKIYDTIRTRLAESRGLTPSSSSSAAKEQQKAKPKAAVSKAKPKPPKPMFPNAGADSMQMPGFETTSSFAPKLGTKYDRNSSRRAKREAIRNARKTLKHPSDHHAVMVTQVDTDILRRQGFDVKTDSGTATVIANKEGAIIHVLEGEQTPDQVKDFLSKRYNIVAQQSGPGVITMPTKDHPGGLLIDPKLTPSEEIPGDKFVGNRKKMRNKKRAIQEKQYSSLTRWPMPRPTNPYSIPLGIWATQGGDWPEGLDYGTEYHSDREVICESDDDDLVKALDRDSFGNHSMLMRLELNSVDAPDEKAAETVMNRYMEPADLGPGIDPKVPRYIIPSGGGGGSPGASKKLPVGTTKKDVPILMKYAAPHKQMRALDAMRIPYKYELTQVLTPHLNDEGEVVPHFPKRIAILSKITLLPKSRYRSLNPPTEEETKEEEKPPEEQEKEVKEEAAPKISKSQRKRMKKKMKLAQQNSEEGATGGIAEDPALPEDDLALDPDEIVHSKHDQPPEMMEDDEDSSDESRSHTVAREKFKYCENCGQEITSRILLCAGCKKVAYCNYRCQKASWKVHKKTCSYALRKDGKESTG